MTGNTGLRLGNNKREPAPSTPETPMCRRMFPLAMAALSLLTLGWRVNESSAETLQLFNTGVGADGAVLSDGTLDDPHYSLSLVPSGSSGRIQVRREQGGWPVSAAGHWLLDNSLSAWIRPNNGNSPGDFTDNSPNGTYSYRTTFLSTTEQVHISGRWSADDEGMQILLNGTATGNSTPDGAFSQWTPFVIDMAAPVGVNELQFRVNNSTDRSPVGLRVEFDVVPEPSTIVLLGVCAAGLLACVCAVRAEHVESTTSSVLQKRSRSREMPNEMKKLIGAMAALVLTCCGAAAAATWIGHSDAWSNSQNWDTLVFAPPGIGNNDPATFNDTAMGGYVLVDMPVAPGLVIVRNNTQDYTFHGPGPLNGVSGLTKDGTGTLNVQTTASFVGWAQTEGGTTNVLLPGSLASDMGIMIGAFGTATVNAGPAKRHVIGRAIISIFETTAGDLIPPTVIIGTLTDSLNRPANSVRYASSSSR